MLLRSMNPSCLETDNMFFRNLGSTKRWVGFVSVNACLSSCGVEWEDIKVKGTVMYKHEWRSVMYSYKI